MVKEIYDAASKWYESMYIEGNDNIYMKDEKLQLNIGKIIKGLARLLHLE